MASEPLPDQDNTKLFEEIDAYPWDGDSGFQGGLAAILGPNSESTPSQTHDLTLRARLYYYARIKNLPPIDFVAYKAHLARKSTAAVAEKPPNPVRFDEIVALITSGKPIPGIKDIPPTVLSDQATKSTASKRRKPWEKDEDLAVNEKTFGDRRDEAILQDMHYGELSTQNADGSFEAIN